MDPGRLHEFRAALDAADPGDAVLFAANVRRALELGLFADERELALRMGMSRTQVDRWKDGRSVPPRGTVRNVYRILASAAS